MNRRFFALAVGSAAMLTACGGAGGSQGASGGNTATYGPNNTVIMAGNISDAVTLDPGSAYEFSSGAADTILYRRLVQFPPGNLKNVKGELASTWNVSQDGKTWTFHLKKNAKFSNGDPVTAKDVVYSFKRALNLPKDPAIWLITQMGITAQNVDQTVVATDPHTITFNLPQPFSEGAFLAVMAANIASVVDAKVVKQHVQNGDWGAHWLYDHSAGGGPYVLDNWTKDVKMVFTANKNYSGTAPKIKKLIWKNVSESTAQLDMLKKGGADIATNLTAAQIQSLQGSSKIKIYKQPEIAMEYLGMGVKTIPALGNPDVREAIKYAIDYQSIIKNLLNGNGVILQSIIPHGIFGHQNTTPFTYNIQKAKSLMAKGGYAKGFTATLLIPNAALPGGVDPSALGDVIKSDLAKIGITVNIRQLQASELYTLYRGHKAQLVLAGWSMDYPDPQDFAGPFADYTQKSLIWRLQDDNKSLAKLAEKAAAMTNTPQRAALYAQINSDLKTGPFALMYQPDQVVAYSSKLQNFQWDPENGFDWQLMSK